MFAGTAAAEIRARHQNRRIAKARLLQHKPAVGLSAPVIEEPRTESTSHYRFQKLLGDDLVGINVGPIHRSHQPGEIFERFHCPVPFPRYYFVHSRTSTKWPATAAAAAIIGLTRCVRPPAPWRPSKLRLEVLAHRSPGRRMSGFIPRHILHPASRHSKPASVKILSRPSASASSFTICEPGTTSA